jgi:peptidoglycan hydrolase-like protein with peptidoglycan-binding domain
MGEFFDSIKDELDQLDAEGGGPTMEFGADGYNSNAAVLKQVQAAINALGYTPALGVDGAMGPKTAAGVKWVQAREGVAQDGIVGDQTLGSLGITPPGGTSVSSVTGAVTGAATQALAAIQQEFSSLLDWASSNPQPITQGKGIAPGFAATRASVVNSYVDWTTPLEGFLYWMYIDALGYVTTGLGNLIDSPGAAQALPWKNANGSTASSAQVAAAWQAVDAQRTAPKGQRQGGAGAAGGGTQGHVTSIRITKADVHDLVAAKMKQNESLLVSGLPNLAQAPADAQLAMHSMAWAMGPGFAIPGNPKAFPGLIHAFNAGDYKTASAQSTMKGTGIAHRNDANKLLLQNAAQVVAAKKDPDTLFYIDGLGDLFGVGGLLGGPAALLALVKKHPIKVGGAVVVVLAGVAALAAQKA